MRIALAFSSLFIITAFAADTADRAKLAGSWQDNGIAWAIQDKGSTIHITRSEGSRIVAEFDCNAAGRECEGKDSGHKATVTMWFNGGVLVQMETKGTEIVKRRFAVSGPDDVLELETVPLTPAGPTETVHFKRIATTTAAR